MLWFEQSFLVLLVDVSVKSFALALIAATALGILRVRNTNVRHRVWTAVLVAMLVLPLLVPLTPSSGQLAFFDMSGLAKVEFSLLPFRDAKPLGTLEDGVVQITHESGTSIRISDVTNGVHREMLIGGPYQVFVRWSEPSMNDSEYRKELEKMISQVKKRMESGDLPAGKDWLQRLERAGNSDRVMMMSYGLGPIPAEDVIPK